MDYKYFYNGEEYKIPKNKIFECLSAVDDVVPVTKMGASFTANEFLKASKMMSILGEFSGQKFDTMSIAQHYLYGEGGAQEIYVALGGLVELLAPPESYNPPESKQGKGKAAG